MNGTYTAAERRHVGRVKELPCAVCNEPGPSHAHHIRQHQHGLIIPLCWHCHQGPGGWHGDKSRWRLFKIDELDALNDTIKKLARGAN